MTLREFQVYVVEVCLSCDWNHLIEQYLLGRDGLAGDDATGGRLAASASGTAAPSAGVGPAHASGRAGTTNRRREAKR